MVNFPVIYDKLPQIFINFPIELQVLESLSLSFSVKDLGGGVEVGMDRNRRQRLRAVYRNGHVIRAFPSWCSRTFKLAPKEERSGVPNVAIPLKSEGDHGSARRPPNELVLESRAFQAPTDERPEVPKVAIHYL